MTVMTDYLINLPPRLRGRTVRSKRKKPYNSRVWLQAGAENCAFMQSHFSECNSWFDASIDIADCNRKVHIHALSNETEKDKRDFIKKLRVITTEIDKLVKKIEGSIK